MESMGLGLIILEPGNVCLLYRSKHWKESFHDDFQLRFLLDSDM